MKKETLLLLTLSLLIISGSAFSQQANPVISKVHEAIRSGNAGTLATYFHSTVDLEVDGTDGSYSKGQAEMIIKDFFTGHPVKSYVIKHQGSSDDGSKYSIGSYITKTNQEFRVYILLKQTGSGLLVNQIQFEED